MKLGASPLGTKGKHILLFAEATSIRLKRSKLLLELFAHMGRRAHVDVE